MLKCTACGGVYAPSLADGTAYYHTCPPLSAVEVAAAVAALKIVLPALETPDIAVTRRTYVRANARDENVVPPLVPNGPVTIKAIGAGTSVAAAPVASVVIVP